MNGYPLSLPDFQRLQDPWYSVGDAQGNRELSDDLIRWTLSNQSRKCSESDHRVWPVETAKRGGWYGLWRKSVRSVLCGVGSTVDRSLILDNQIQRYAVVMARKSDNRPIAVDIGQPSAQVPVCQEGPGNASG